MANQQFSYTLTPGKSVNGMMDAAMRYLSISEGMETLTLPKSSGNVSAIQARVRGGALKQLVGMDKALTVRFLEDGNHVTVEFGEAKWGDKAAVMAVSMFFLWPLAVTSGYGIYKQKQLPQKVKNAIDNYMFAI